MVGQYKKSKFKWLWTIFFRCAGSLFGFRFFRIAFYVVILEILSVAGLIDPANKAAILQVIFGDV